MELSANFTKIVNKGCSDVVFTTDQKSIFIEGEEDIKCEIVNDELHISSKPGFNNSNGNNISVYGSGVCVINGIVYIDGQKIDVKKPLVDDKAYSKHWKINGIPKITRINLQGSSDLVLVSLMLADKLNICLSGSGDISIPRMHLKVAKINLTGSGDITFDQSTIEHLQANITGSGDISHFIITQTAELNIIGSGDLKGKAKKGSNIEKNKIGSGSFKIALF